ncbi:MAG: hypothetical protein FWD63_08435 [Propionibacteriaceae bacterium]|nr:hypothetical protein [Propionibacteriaceae bacterium]
MPTVLERTTITHTPQVVKLLTVASHHWTDTQSSRDLMVDLMNEGAASLRNKELAAAYEAAFLEWDGSEDAALWDSISGDGDIQ